MSGVTDVNIAETPKPVRLNAATLAQWRHEEAMAQAQRESQERVTLSRDKDGYHWTINGVRGNAETLLDCLDRATEAANHADDFCGPYRPKLDAGMARNAAGNVQLDVSGADPEQVKAIFTDLHAEHALSRKQHADRDYLANEIKPETKAKR